MKLLAPTFADPDHPDSRARDDGDHPGYADVDGAPPPGMALANTLIAGLQAADVMVPNRWSTYEGHGWEARVEMWRFDVTLRLVDREEGTWELTFEPRRGLMPWSRRTPPANVGERLQSAFDTIFDRDDRLQLLV